MHLKMTFLEIIHGECHFLEIVRIILLIKGLNLKQIVNLYIYIKRYKHLYPRIGKFEQYDN